MQDLLREIVRTMLKIERARPGRINPVELACNLGITETITQKGCVPDMEGRIARASATDQMGIRPHERIVEFFQPIIVHDFRRRIKWADQCIRNVVTNIRTAGRGLGVQMI